MNIFYLDDDTKLCAEYHHDVHLRKMITETAQMLSTAHHISGENNPVRKDEIYKPTHANHPSNLWVRDSQLHYVWLYNLFVNMHVEYEYRFDKEHASKKLLHPLIFVPRDLILVKRTPPPLCMPDQYKSDNHVESYRKFYNAEKQFDKNGKFMANYTKREVPYWMEIKQ